MHKLLSLPCLAAVLAVVFSCSSPTDKIISKVFDTAQTQVRLMDERLPVDSLPRTFIDGKPVNSDVTWWCSGFFPGTLWYVYEYTGKPEFKDLAIKNTLKLTSLKNKKTDHDIGFIINSSFGNALRLTGDPSYKEAILEGAHRLASRFNPVTGVTRSWDFNPNAGYPVIIDNMMNLEILLNAVKLGGDDSLKQIALTHANTTMANHFRPDFSTWHMLDYDTSDGHVISRKTVQGYSDDSAWARGQAWAFYGFTMMYRETSDPAYLGQAENIARYLLGRLPEDGIPWWDFDCPDIPDTKRDASAGAIMSSAFVELSTLTSDKSLSHKCLKMAETQFETLSSDEYLAKPGENGNFLLKHSVGSLPGNSEVDVPLTYADYYFLEALLKYRAIRSK